MASARQPVKIGDQTILARELTFAEVRAWVAEVAATPQRDPVHALAFPGLGLDELAKMCDSPVEILESFTAGELQPLVDVVKSLNAPFFRVRSILMAHVDRISSAPDQA
jgi:hypothetical protein